MKDLPYFKFNISEWTNGDITLEDYYTQGVFVNICSHYWFKSGDLTLTEIKRRLPKAKPTAFDSLVESGIIKVKNDVLSISFLDEQLQERDVLSRTNSLNGSLGGRPKKSEQKPTALISKSEPKPKKSNIEERRVEEKIEEEKKGEESIISLSDFELLFDEIWKGNIQMVHKGKDLNQHIKQAYLHLHAGGRLANGTTADFKKCVQAFLNNDKSNGQPKKRVKLL